MGGGEADRARWATRSARRISAAGQGGAQGTYNDAGAQSTEGRGRGEQVRTPGRVFGKPSPTYEELGNEQRATSTLPIRLRYALPPFCFAFPLDPLSLVALLMTVTGRLAETESRRRTVVLCSNLHTHRALRKGVIPASRV